MRHRGLWFALVVAASSTGVATAVATAAVTDIPDPSYFPCPQLPNGDAKQGDAANDTIIGTPLRDLLLGGAGNDAIDGIGR